MRKLRVGVCLNDQFRNSGRFIAGIALLPVRNTDNALISESVTPSSLSNLPSFRN